MGKAGSVWSATPALAKVMPKTRFWTVLGVFDPFLGPAGAEALSQASKSPKSKIQKLCCYESFGEFFFRLLKAPKRLGLSQKVPGKYPFGPNQV